MANEGVMNLPQEQPMQGASEGVMSLPQAQPMQDAPVAQKPQFVSSADSYDATQTALSRIDPQQLAQYKAQIRQAIEKLSPTPEQVDSMITLFEYLNQNKDQYKEIIAQAIQDGNLSEGDLPPEYNPVIIGVVLLILHELKDRQRSTMQPPQGMAGGGIADMAQQLQSRGRHGDSILAHINPEEARLLQQRGGMGSINPDTGLPEFGFFSDLWSGVKEIFKPIVDVAKDIVSSPIGRIIATVALTMVLGPAGAGLSMGMAAAGASAGVTLLGGGSLKDALVSGATAYFGAGGGIGGFNPSEGIQGMLPGGTPAWLSQGLTAGAIGAGAGLLTGQGVGQALKSGLQAGVTSAGSAAGQSYLGVPPPGMGMGPTPAADPTMNGVGPSAPAAPGTPEPIQPIATAQELPPPPSGMGDTPAFAMRMEDTPASTTGMGNASSAPMQATQAPPAAGATPAPPRGIFETLYKAGATAESPQGYIEKAFNWAKGNAGMTDTELKGIKDTAYNDAYSSATRLGQDPTAAAAKATAASNAAGPGMIAKYGPMLGIATLGAQLTGATKPYTPNPQPLAEQWGTGSQTGQAYMDAHPETFGKWKGWNTPGGAPQAQNPVNTPGAQPLATASPYTVPSNAPSNYLAGSTIPQPYNSPYSVMPTRMYNVGGTVNDPDTAGGNIVPNMTNTFSGGGGMGYAAGGNPSSYPRRNGEISGSGTGTSDSIPAMLSDGEFVLTAKAVRNAGNGSRREGAKRMYKLMHMLERGGNVKGA